MSKPSRKKRKNNITSPVVVPANIVDENRPVDNKPRRGRPSYADKARSAGVYKKIAYTIMSIRKNNIGISNKDIYRTLNSMYPEVFDKEDMDGGNATKILTSDSLWELMLGTNRDDEDEFMMLTMYNVFHQEDAKNSDIIKAYKTIKDIQLREREIEEASAIGLDINTTFIMSLDGD